MDARMCAHDFQWRLGQGKGYVLPFFCSESPSSEAAIYNETVSGI